MNKKERALLCEMVVSWEFTDRTGGVSHAMGVDMCRVQVIETFGLTDEEMEFDRQFAILKLLKISTDEDDIWDHIDSIWKQYSYSEILDMVDNGQFKMYVEQYRGVK